ncbi:MAG TPA: hypothetical protein VNX18_22850 [Bryobacteraceae bacterium]|jgi:hypothetical protein|nr:hypothetical protein [Bryobacteraceae bacterium]
MRILLLLIAAARSLRAESGRLTIHMILHAIGEERYEIRSGDRALTQHTVFEYSDRGNKRTRKRADLILVDGNPLEDIRDPRRVSRVIVSGRMYDPAKLWGSAGFRP